MACLRGGAQRALGDTLGMAQDAPGLKISTKWRSGHASHALGVTEEGSDVVAMAILHWTIGRFNQGAVRKPYFNRYDRSSQDTPSKPRVAESSVRPAN
jgi:hypothetical protein